MKVGASFLREDRLAAYVDAVRAEIVSEIVTFPGRIIHADMRSRILLWRVAVCSMLTAATIAGQVVTASLEGIVQDPTGAVVPSAKVQVINTSTNVQTTAGTNSEGRFFLPSLQPGGPYTVVVEASGFKKEERAGIILQVNQSARINIQLQLGAATETVKVSGDAPLLETATAAMLTRWSFWRQESRAAFPRRSTARTCRSMEAGRGARMCW